MQGIFLENITKGELLGLIQNQIRDAISEAGIDMRITTSEAARILDCTEATINNYHRSGKIQNLSPGEHAKWSLREVIKLKRSKK